MFQWRNSTEFFTTKYYFIRKQCSYGTQCLYCIYHAKKLINTEGRVTILCGIRLETPCVLSSPDLLLLDTYVTDGSDIVSCVRSYRRLQLSVVTDVPVQLLFTKRSAIDTSQVRVVVVVSLSEIHCKTLQTIHDHLRH